VARLVPERRFAAIWVALLLLVGVSALVAPQSLRPASLGAVLPFAAFLAIAGMGQALVIKSGGIDLSVPAVVSMVGVTLLSASSGTDEGLFSAIVLALLLAAVVGLANGVLVALCRLNPLLVTLATGSLVTGATLRYQSEHQIPSQVPPALADLGASTWLTLNMNVAVALVLMLLASSVLRHTTTGRRFTAVGASPVAARLCGLCVEAYQVAAYGLAALFYATVAILAAAFIRSPTLRLGEPYLLSPICVVVLGGTSLTGGVGSMVAVVGAALFLTQLDQMLRVMGQPTSIQYVFQGAAIAIGMGIASVGRDVPALRFLQRRSART
jgi:ribose transport system permease protein